MDIVKGVCLSLMIIGVILMTTGSTKESKVIGLFITLAALEYGW